MQIVLTSDENEVFEALTGGGLNDLAAIVHIWNEVGDDIEIIESDPLADEIEENSIQDEKNEIIGEDK
jgi:hypothetical protein